MSHENKAFKYLRKITGEITRVVIGILIAVQINNWNKDRSKTNLGTLYMVEMKTEIQSDIDRLDNVLNGLDNHIQLRTDLLSSEDLTSFSHDELTQILNTPNLGIKIHQLVFDKMKNLGISSISINPELNEFIYKYYNLEIVALELFLSFHVEHLNRDHEYFLYKQDKIDWYTNYEDVEFPILYGDLDEAKELNKKYIIDFVTSTEGRNIVLNTLDMDYTASSRFKRFLERSLILLKMINEELDKEGYDEDKKDKKLQGYYFQQLKQLDN